MPLIVPPDRRSAMRPRRQRAYGRFGRCRNRHVTLLLVSERGKIERQKHSMRDPSGSPSRWQERRPAGRDGLQLPNGKAILLLSLATTSAGASG